MLWNQASVCGTEGAEGTAGNPGTWTRSRRERRRDYGSDYGSAQPHHTGVYQPTPVESQQPACGVLEQLQHTVSACNYFLFYLFIINLCCSLSLHTCAGELVFSPALTVCCSMFLLFTHVRQIIILIIVIVIFIIKKIQKTRRKTPQTKNMTESN